MIEYLAANCGYAHKKSRFHQIRDLRNMAIHRSPGLTVDKVRMMIAETGLLLASDRRTAAASRTLLPPEPPVYRSLPFASRSGTHPFSHLG